MTDREALTAALEDEKRIIDPDFDDYTIEVNSANFAAIYQLASRYLAQLPEKCEHKRSEPHRIAGRHEGMIFKVEGWECSGRVYPAELVERIMGVIDIDALDAVAVLDALNRETP